MNKQEFARLLQNQILVLDGATGSNLQKMGMPANTCVEKWVCEHEDALIKLQKAYIEAGSQAVYASTFGANRVKLMEFGLEQEVKAINSQAVAISKKAADNKALVIGDVTMTGQQLEPLGSLSFDELVDTYKEQMSALEQAGADLLVVETMLSLQETRAALLAAKEAVSLPVIATMTFGEDGRTLYGTDAKTAAVVMSSLGASAVGVNCSAGPDKMLPVIQTMKQTVNTPIIAKPNAGLPKLGADGLTAYDMSPETFVGHMKALVDEGATVLGGCCGTNPEYIRALCHMLEEHQGNFEKKADESVIYLTSERKTVVWREDCVVKTIGTEEFEEINEEWADELYDTLYDEIDEAADDEAAILCICVDGNPENREEIAKKVVQEAAGYTALPLIFQSEHISVLEAALRAYPGKSAVRYTGADGQRLKDVAEYYGASVL